MCQFKIHSVTAFRWSMFRLEQKHIISNMMVKNMSIQKSLIECVLRINSEDKWWLGVVGLEAVGLDGFHPSDSDTSKITPRQRFANQRSYDIRLESIHIISNMAVKSVQIQKSFFDNIPPTNVIRHPTEWNTSLWHIISNMMVKIVSIQKSLFDRVSPVNVNTTPDWSQNTSFRTWWSWWSKKC